MEIQRFLLLAKTLKLVDRVLDNLNKESDGRLEEFKYYLERHIELDGDDHGPMAARLLKSLCGDDKAKWEKAEKAAVDCLVARRQLWDGIYEEIDRDCAVHEIEPGVTTDDSQETQSARDNLSGLQETIQVAE